MIYLGRKHERTLVPKVNYCSFTNSPLIPNNSQKLVEDGIATILDHFDEPLWPRTIATKTTEGRQVLVNNQEEAIARFEAANWWDCRISAYTPNPTENRSGLERFVGVMTVTPANIVVMIDLDRSNFKTDRGIDLVLTKTLQTIKKTLGEDINPTVIFSGNGYHVYVVINSNGINLEYEEIFTKLTDQPSRKFMQFAEEFLSNGKSDRTHNKTVSLNNCMLRIPGSLNSKNGQRVQLLNNCIWDGYRPEINYMLADFAVYLANQKAQKSINMHNIQQRTYLKNINFNHDNNKTETETVHYPWIERLLYTSITNGRKYCIWRILIPYLINRKHVSQQECIGIVKTWLDQCSKMQHINFNVNQKLNEAIKRVGNYGPAHPGKLKEEYPQLYDLFVACRVLI